MKDIPPISLPMSSTNPSVPSEAGEVRKSRVQFDLPPRSMERLNALKGKTEAASYAEVAKNALRLYEALIEETEQGRSFLIRDEKGSVRHFNIFL